MDVGTEETIRVLEANIDDMNPQIYGYFLEKALAAGALDVFTTPVQMKKSRPGMLITVLCKPHEEQIFQEMLFAETTTLGVRSHTAQRRILPRAWEKVSTQLWRCSHQSRAGGRQSSVRLRQNLKIAVNWRKRKMSRCRR